MTIGGLAEFPKSGDVEDFQKGWGQGDTARDVVTLVVSFKGWGQADRDGGNEILQGMGTRGTDRDGDKV